MGLQHRTGDLFASRDLDALAHGCNCAGAMGKGIAVAFKRRWPAMYQEYRARCRDGRFGLGDVLAWSAPGLVVYNLGTQPHWTKGAELPAIGTAVGRMLDHAVEHGVRAIGMPRIGAGLGGLAWGEVEDVIASRLAATPGGVTVVVHTP